MTRIALLAACGFSACMTAPLPPPTIAPTTATGPFATLPVETIARFPTTGGGDEFDRVSGTLNRMLDRIGLMMDNLR